MNTWTCTRQGELYHHGIKGQKWGVRRFQNKDGSLTPAGKRRYDEPNVGRTTSESKTKEPKKYKIPKKKSLHRLKLEEKYRNEGMKKKDAEQKAARRIKAEALVAAAAVTTVAACIAYNKYKGYTSDKIFKEGSEFHRIMRLAENAEIKDGRQYLAFDKNDRIKYKGMLGDTLQKGADRANDAIKKNGLNNPLEKVYDVTVKNKSELRVASEKRVRDTFEQLYKNDSEFRDGVNKTLKDKGLRYAMLNANLQKIATKADNGKTFTNRELKKDVYDLFNIMLVDKDATSVKNSNKFYDALRKQGVNALMDINDKKYSGYKSKMPIITIDDGFEYSRRVMEKPEIKDNLKKGCAMIITPEIVKAAVPFMAVYGSAPVVKKYQVDRRVAEYKSKHPNTNMSDAEIKDMVKEQMKKEEDE